MNIKDKLIRKLLDVGKKHRILVYPTLILVAIISAISHAVYWGRGNGKRLVASVSIVALLITQSLFLTSSALDDSEEPNISTEESTEASIEESTEEVVDTSDVTDNEVADAEAAESDDSVNDDSDDTDTEAVTEADGDATTEGDIADNVLDASSEEETTETLTDNVLNQNLDTLDNNNLSAVAMAALNGIDTTELDLVGATGAYSANYIVVYKNNATDYNDNGEITSLDISAVRADWSNGGDAGIEVTGPYTDSSCTTEADISSKNPEDWNAESDGSTINIYYKAMRKSYNVSIISGNETKNVTVTLAEPSNDISAAASMTVGSATE